MNITITLTVRRQVQKKTDAFLSDHSTEMLARSWLSEQSPEPADAKTYIQRGLRHVII